MAEVFLSIGSNIERRKNILSCIRELRRHFPDIQFSNVYETPAEGFEGNAFYNLAARHTTTLGHTELGALLKQIEAQHGRDHSAAKYSSRTLDIDLLLYDQLNLQPEIDLPRREITRYAFVLFPLAEIGADAMHPEFGQTIAEIAAASTLERASLRQVSIDPAPSKH